ncbi:MAG TPA: putative porin [Bacteroidales bacterium]
MKSIVIFFLITFILAGVKAQDTARVVSGRRDTVRVKHPKIIAFQFNRDFTSLDTIKIDTTLRRFQLYYKPISDRALDVFLGNLNSPYVSSIYANRQPYSDFIFSQYIEYNFHQPEELIYYKTWSPFTELTYYTGGPKSNQEQKLNILHTQNINKNLNVGFLGDLNYSDGQYTNQRTRTSAFTLWAGYKGARYSNFGSVSLDSYKAQENGGILLDSTYKSNVDPKTIPVNLQDANVVIKRQSIFFYQRFYITGSFKSDSLKESSRWNEAVSLIHKFKYERYRRGYTDDLTTSDSAYYQTFNPDFNYNRKSVADSSYFRRVENTVQIAFNANELLKVPAELRFGIKNQVDRYKYGSKLDSTTYYTATDTFSLANPMVNRPDVNTAFVGSLSDRFSRTIRWGASGEYYFTGSKIGSFDLNGDIEKSIKHNFILRLTGRLALTKPGFFIREFKSNSISWANTSSFPSQKTSTIHLGLYHVRYKFYVDAQLDNYSDFLYFGSDAKPTYAKVLSVQSLTVNKLIDWGIFHTDFRLTFQNSTDKNAVAIPSFSGFNSTYLGFTLFKVLQLQIGGDIFYNTQFNADSYMPETGLFYSQSTIKVGNYPYADMFLNIKLKRFRFFLKYERVNTFFPNSEGYYMPHYPFNSSILKYGLSWTFYD